jgi:protocatechuate 3,4-dioxygenase beta subunit
MKTLWVLILLTISLQACTQSGTTVKNQPVASIKRLVAIVKDAKLFMKARFPFHSLNEVDTLPDFNDQDLKFRSAELFINPMAKPGGRNYTVCLSYRPERVFMQQKEMRRAGGKRHGYIRGWIKTNEKRRV